MGMARGKNKKGESHELKSIVCISCIGLAGDGMWGDCA